MSEYSTPIKLVQKAYDALLRPHLPRKWVTYGEIPARDGRLFDATDTVRPYKPGLKQAISSHVTAGDGVTIVGAGRGICSVWSAQQDAQVTAYEAADEMVSIARETVRLQGFGEDVTVRHALVGEAIEVYGDYSAAEVIPPSEFEPGTVLVMDCEGAERSILAGLQKRPSTVIVETHPERGVPTTDVFDLLVDGGYTVERFQYAPGYSEKQVLAGLQEGDSSPA